MESAVNRNAMLHALRQHGTNLREWYAKEGYGYRNVSNVLHNISHAHFGQGKEIADKLNAIPGPCAKSKLRREKW